MSGDIFEGKLFIANFVFMATSALSRTRSRRGEEKVAVVEEVEVELKEE